MKKRSKKGFVVSAILYPLLVLFLALIMGMLSMTDTRKKILDRMKLEVQEDLLNNDTCSCDTIMNKLNWIIKNGVGGHSGGSYTYNVLGLNVKSYPTDADMPRTNNAIGDIAIISDLEVVDYYVATTPPKNPKNGSVWVVQDINSPYYVESDYSKIGINYCMQYEDGTWYLKETYVFTSDGKWTRLYFVDLDGTKVNLNGTNINATAQWTFDYTGKYQIFEPVFSGYYKIELWGAQGGNYNASIVGGKGAYTSGEIYLDKNDKLYIYVGGQGTNPSDYGISAGGGWNGGGDGMRSSGNSSNYGAAGGGGSTDVRLERAGTTATEWNVFNSLKSRIMVAAGGGGSVYYGSGNAAGSAAGGLYGFEGTVDGGSGRATTYYNSAGRGGTQSGGGWAGATAKTKGGFGYGGEGVDTPGYYTASGGGSGWFGGGGAFSGGNNGRNSGGSGSSYISGYNGCNSIAEESVINNIIMTGSAYHYSGYYFRNGRMIDGNGYDWNEAMPFEVVNQPTNDGRSRQTGQSGNGYAKITMMTVEVLERKDLAQQARDNETYFAYGAGENVQRFTAPVNGYYNVQLWGAEGGYLGNASGGGGSYTSGDIYLNKGTVLYVAVGTTGDSPGGYGFNAGGGWNGGGDGIRSSGNNSNRYAGGGGGATDIRVAMATDASDWSNFNSLKSRIMVAAGGSGAAAYGNGSIGTGASGGGYIGYQGTCDNGVCTEPSGSGIGATQTVAGYATMGGVETMGGFGYGGRGLQASGYYTASGGGSGYYGGGGAYGFKSNGRITGGSGSCFISGALGFDSVSQDAISTNITFTGSAFHYSGYYFINTKVIDGYGYEWKDGVRATTVSKQPTYDGLGLQTGNIKGGNAIIKLINKVTKTDTEIEDIKSTKERYWNFTGNGTYHTFTVPKTGSYRIELWGAAGGTFNESSSYGGLGGYTAGTINLTKGNKLYIYVGVKGKNTTEYAVPSGGGWNGGGNAVRSSGNDANNYAGGGGGSTDVRTVPTTFRNIWNEEDSLKSRIMVAAGGSGAAEYGNSGNSPGSPAGGLVGYSGTQDSGAASHNRWAGSAGTQIAGGQATDSAYSKAGFGYGGSGVNINGYYNASGGGGGWYGGGGSYPYNNGRTTGGTGSSYISGHPGCIGINSSGNPLASTYSTLADSISYLNYSFTDTLMVDGTGYQWTTSKATKVNQPAYDGVSTQEGNRYDGFAKITYIGATS